MSNKTCKDCFHFYGVAEDMNGEVGMCDLQSSEYPNYKVAGETACDKFNAPTVFDRITASPEVLAPEFVGIVFDHRYTSRDRFYSMLTKEFYDSESEAIAATVVRLKEVDG